VVLAAKINNLMQRDDYGVGRGVGVRFIDAAIFKINLTRSCCYIPIAAKTFKQRAAKMQIVNII